MNNGNDLNLHSMTKLSGWLRYCIRTKLKEDDTLTSRTNLTIDDIIPLLDFTLFNIYFIYNTPRDL